MAQLNFERKNILFISSAEQMFGSEQSLFEIVQKLSNIYMPIVLFPREGKLSNLFRKRNIQVRIFDVHNGNLFRRSLSLYRIIKSDKIICIHVNYHADLPKIFFISKLINIPVIVHMRMTCGLTLTEMFMFRFSNKVICVSEAVKKCLIRQRRLKGMLKVKESNLDVIYDGEDIQQFNSKGDRNLFRSEFEEGSNFCIGIVGAIAPRKRQDLFVKVAAEIIKEDKTFRFFIVGDIYGDRHKNYKYYVADLIVKLNLSNYVKMIGRRDDIPSVMKGLDILLNLSEKEAFGLVVLEALSVGTPVVALEVEGIAEILGCNEGGILVNSPAPYKIAKEVIGLAYDSDRYNEMKKLGEQRANKFDIKNTIMRIENIYNCLFH